MITAHRPISMILKRARDLTSNFHAKTSWNQELLQDETWECRFDGDLDDPWEPTETLKREANWDSDTPRV